jgi:carbamate kinase
LAEVAAEHDVAITHDCSPRVGHMLELALQNALPERDVVTVLTQVVISGEDAALADPSGQPEPNAIVELRSLRMLIDSGALVICTGGGGLPVTIAADGTMRGLEVEVDPDLTAALLARRLDVDQLLLICGAGAAKTVSKEDAARRFVEATGRHAAIGPLTSVGRTLRGAVENRVASRYA